MYKYLFLIGLALIIAYIYIAPFTPPLLPAAHTQNNLLTNPLATSSGELFWPQDPYPAGINFTCQLYQCTITYQQTRYTFTIKEKEIPYPKYLFLPSLLALYESESRYYFGEVGGHPTNIVGKYPSPNSTTTALEAIPDGPAVKFTTASPHFEKTFTVDWQNQVKYVSP